jgi:hypothetical protein
MYILEYINGNKVLESYPFQTKALCLWKKKQLLYNGTHIAERFRISRG